ncbi:MULTISPECIES: transglycosylase SLT domain-containing protein [unclassified Streptomyces]|uniref:transglycosylase SLT domain-containing protein n=1 Tax=unclassified Streptomyces TaxID=2593676 RepID=UPI002DD92780|nr:MULTISPECIES: transglycosylase SLT domain-containing protein [unclassified Streptomyces]WSA95303.1 transglycosylase SLT domain-containing protein [Streptomyces sp. NBC_01795]WSB79722.1 transglycosylase SLT domain-containing protein [Streptomyces sp. NBC_01775]WSS12072.1 transglycosylase SLT domain-containing protein [Streptomyces sp. NBC_01186]WSS40786.1 transglycosylase SLT domain-containing protein [Streptomyces sp. NBC_01187]
MPSITGFTLSPKAKKISTIGIGTAGAAALALTVIPGTAAHGDSSQASAKKISAQDTAFSSTSSSVLPKQGKDLTGQSSSSLLQLPKDGKKVESAANATTTAQATQAKKAAEAKAAAAKAAATKKAQAEAKAAKERAAKQAASRSAKRAAAPTYPNNLDGWIREARAIMAKHGIPGSYEGIKRNIIRESGGDPKAQNNWDINAQNGVPSKGLLQTIQPTFNAYHVDGTSTDMTDPVANIVAACNYAADRYGSMDNVNSAY